MATRTKGSSKSAAHAWQSPEVRDAIASLPRLIAVWPSELIAIEDPKKSAGWLAKLRKALRAERQRGIAGHWTYDLARHTELLAVYRILVGAQRETEAAKAAPGAPDLRQSLTISAGARKTNGPAR
jgi:hypothetical protein